MGLVAAANHLDRRREVLRQASAALGGRVVVLWEVTSEARIEPVLASLADPPRHTTDLDLEQTLRRWNAPVLEGSRWVGCRLTDDGRWCVAPVRRQAPAPPPGGRERRSPERMTLELAGLCVGLSEMAKPETGVRRSGADALLELSRQPSVIAHEVANPLTASLASIELSLQSVEEAQGLEAVFRAELLDGLSGVRAGIEQAIRFLRSIQDRGRGALARAERFDIADVVRSCVILERPLSRKAGVALQAAVTVAGIFLRGDPNALYQILTNLIRNAVTASAETRTPVVVALGRAADEVRLSVQDQGGGIAAHHLERIFEAGFTTKQPGAGSGTGLAVVQHLAHEVFRGTVQVESRLGMGSTFTVALPIPPQRSGPSAPE